MIISKVKNYFITRSSYYDFHQMSSSSTKIKTNHIRKVINLLVINCASNFLSSNF